MRRRLLDFILYSSLWLAAAAAAQTAATLRQLPAAGAAGGRLVAMVFGATLLVYNLDAALPFKHRQPAGASARKSWQQRHRGWLVALATGAGLGAAYVFWVDGWWRYLPQLAPLAGLALGYSWPVLPWRGRRRALREVPLLKVFLIAGVWTLVTVGLPVLLLRHPLREVGGLLAQRFLLVSALAVVFDIRDVARDRLAGTRTFPNVLGLFGAKAVALALLAGAMAFGLGRGAPPLAVLGPGALAAAVIAGADETRHDYYYALLTDGLLLVQAGAYFLVPSAVGPGGWY